MYDRHSLSVQDGLLGKPRLPASALRDNPTEGLQATMLTKDARRGGRPSTSRDCRGLLGKAVRMILQVRETHDTRAIQGWLGHRSITSTAVYTALAPNQFKDFWR
jgi:integrase